MTPFWPEGHRDSEAGGAGAGPVIECPYCKHACPPPRVYKSVEELEKRDHARRSALKKEIEGSGVRAAPQEVSGTRAATSDKFSTTPVVGRLQPVASRILMKILWVARLARPDLLRAVCHLACFVTKWDPSCDRRLHRLVGYIHGSKSLRQIGYVADTLGCLEPHLFADADFAGCTATQRSTSGLHLVIRGPGTCFPRRLRIKEAKLCLALFPGGGDGCS